MDSEEIKKLAGKFGEVNSQERTVHDSTGQQEESKLDFFWNSCMPADDSDVTSSIKKKTWQKIAAEKRQHRLKRIYITSASIAASLIIIFFATYFLMPKDAVATTDVEALASQVSRIQVNNVTLISGNSSTPLSTGAVLQYDSDGHLTVDGKSIASVEGNDMQKLIVPDGKRVRVNLSDGTVLNVNSQSSLVYPRRFNGDTRRIFARGEVLMDVAHDAKHPFIVSSDEFNLRVLGTKFNICTYKNMGANNIVLVRGKVEVTDKKSRMAILMPNDMLSIKDGSITAQTKVDVDEYVSWADGMLVLNGESLATLTRRLSIYYGRPIHCLPSLNNKKIYGKLELKDSLREVLTCLKPIVPINIVYHHKEVFLK